MLIAYRLLSFSISQLLLPLLLVRLLLHLQQVLHPFLTSPFALQSPQLPLLLLPQPLVLPLSFIAVAFRKPLDQLRLGA